MTHLPPLAALRALEAAARHRSYSRAADELAVTHGAVSQQIRRLEAELGATLFVRRGNSMEPTPEAQRLAGEISQALCTLREAVAEFAGAPAPEPLVLSVGGFIAHRWLPPRLPRLLAHPAGAHIEIRLENRHVDLAVEDVDVGIRFGIGRWDGLACARLRPETIFPVCTPELAERLGLKSPADLLRAPLLHRSTRPWAIWFSHYGVDAPAPAGPVFDDPIMMLQIAAQGSSVGLADESLVGDELATGRLVRPLGDLAVPDHAIYMLWRPESPKLTRILALRDWLLAEVQAERVEAIMARGPQRSPFTLR